MKARITSILVVLSAFAFQVHAQEQVQDTDSVLTFREAVDIALKNNLTLNQQRNNLSLSQANKTFRMAQLGPQASINGGVGQRNGNNFIQQEGRVVNATVYLASASFNASMPIFNGFSNFNTM